MDTAVLFDFFFFFFNDTATTEIYTLSLHDALPISGARGYARPSPDRPQRAARPAGTPRSEEHTSELQSQSNLVCRLLLEKKKKLKERILLDGEVRHLVLVRDLPRLTSRSSRRCHIS